MKQIIRNIILCALILSVFPFAAPAQKKGPEQVAIRFTVVDQLGNPVPGAEVSVGEGMGRFMTDADGRVSVNCAVTDVVRVEMDGFKFTVLKKVGPRLELIKVNVVGEK